MATKLDKSACSVVIFCTECPWWRGFRITVLEAHNCACDHEAAVHPGATQASNARSIYRARHAA